MEIPSPIERTPEEWAAFLMARGEPRYRGMQVFRWIHQRGVLDPEAMTDLPKTLRAKLAEETFSLGMSVELTHLAQDQTRKLLLRMDDGKTIESVLIPMSSGGDSSASVEDNEDEEGLESGSSWVTQCISSQVGCAMACVFCASGIAGLKRHLSAGEIVGQVMVGRRESPDARPRNVVLMGMGEPLHNYDAVARALTLLCHPDGLALSRRRVTVSTSGLVPEIDRLGRDFDGQVQLAISLHAPDERRSEIMPINRKYPLPELIASLKRYPLPKRRRITIEYTLIAGFNETPQEAKALAKLLRGIPVKVNLIPMNEVSDNPLRAPTWETVDAFQEALRRENVPSFVRRRKGEDIAAACGQLALLGATKTVRVPLPRIRS